MALSDGNVVTTMPVAPAYGGDGIGGFGNDGWWIILLLLFACGGNGFGFGGGFGADGLYPWLNNSENINGGFRDAQISSSISSLQNSVTSGFGDVQTALCGGFAGVNASIANGFAQSEIAENARQIANMQQMYGLSTQLSNCCCENRLGIANLGADIAREACADRQAVVDGVRDIIANQTAGIQSILTQMCNDKIDAKNDTINQLRQELLYARGQASQDVQTARILAGQTSEVDALYNRLSSCPVPSTPVYGNQPIFTYNGNGCGCNG